MKSFEKTVIKFPVSVIAAGSAKKSLLVITYERAVGQPEGVGV